MLLFTMLTVNRVTELRFKFPPKIYVKRGQRLEFKLFQKSAQVVSMFTIEDTADYPDFVVKTESNT